MNVASLWRLGEERTERMRGPGNRRALSQR